MRKYILLTLTLFLVACGGESANSSEPTAVVVEVVETATAVNTPTPEPTNTAAPTDTPVPTNTPEPTLAPSPTPEPVVDQSEWLTYAVPTSGYYLSLPPSWREIPVDEETFRSTIAALRDENPQIQQLFENNVIQTLLLSGANFIGFDLSVESTLMNSPANINIIKEERPSPVSLDFLLDLSVGQLENLENVSSDVQSDIIELPYGGVGRLSFELTIFLPDGTPVLRDTVQYVFMDGATVYNITFSHDAEHSDTYEPIYEAIAASFQLGEPPEGTILTGPPETSEPVLDEALNQWRLFSLAESITIAALAQGYNLSDELINDNLDEANTYSSELQIELPDLLTAVPRDDSRAGINYVFNVQDFLMTFAEKTMGQREASIVELIMSAIIAQVLYDPEDTEQTDAFLNTLSRAALTSGLPTELTQPMLDNMQNNLSWEEVGDSINVMVFDIKQLFEDGSLDLQNEIANPNQILWDLSRQVGMAGLSQGFELSTETTDRSLEKIDTYTALLNIELRDLYETVPSGDLLEGLYYIFENQTAIRTYALGNFGSEAEGIVVIGFHSILIDILYEPNNEEMISTLEEGFREGASLTNVPDIVFDPIFDGFRENISEDEMRQRIAEMNAFMESYVETNP